LPSCVNHFNIAHSVVHYKLLAVKILYCGIIFLLRPASITESPVAHAAYARLSMIIESQVKPNISMQTIEINAPT
jgi:hypothetical protein